MKIFTTTILVTLLSSTAMAAGVASTCTRGDDQRLIEIVSPGTVGAACDVRYTRGAGNVKTPYHANNSPDFCAMKAADLMKDLTVSGFSCVAAVSDFGAPTLAAVPSPAQAPVETAVASAQSDFTVDVQRDDPLVVEPETPVDTGVAEQAEALATNSTGDAVENETLEEKLADILTEPSRDVANAGPAQLINADAPMPQSNVRPALNARLTGASPEAQKVAVNAASQSSSSQGVVEPIKTAALAQETRLEPAGGAPAAPEPAPVEVAEPVAPTPAPAKATSLRGPEDTIAQTLLAQAAAWNEGNLEEFMQTYWKDDDLKFVSGGSITKGWSSTMRRYRDKYRGGEGLGKLSFEKLDVDLVTDDVAIVTGRFNLVRGEETPTGLFSLVMRRDAGVWRIVHDHTSADVPKE